MQFTIPEDGIEQGQSFGLGDTSPFAENWERIGGDANNFDLSTEGDNFFIYCIDADDLPNFLWGYSYSGPWKEAGLADEEYGEAFSALPESLEVVGNTVYEHKDNCVYEGELGGRKTDLQRQFADPGEFICVDDQRIELRGPTTTPRSDARECMSMWTAAMMGLAGAMIVLLL